MLRPNAVTVLYSCYLKFHSFTRKDMDNIILKIALLQNSQKVSYKGLALRRRYMLLN